MSNVKELEAQIKRLEDEAQEVEGSYALMFSSTGKFGKQIRGFKISIDRLCVDVMNLTKKVEIIEEKINKKNNNKG
jgi:outer membrane murein-binding lipoprotein Lpp